MEQTTIGKRFELLSSVLDERSRRLLLGAEALLLGRGGISTVARETGVSRPTISAGVEELQDQTALQVRGRIRREGGGRKRIVDKYPDIAEALDRLVDPVTRGDPESPLRHHG